jgi:site-specific DNA recombinase
MNRKVVAYIRVSTEEQAEHGYSIDVQKQVLEDYAKGHDLEVVKTFIESQSAYKPGRPRFKEMVEYLTKHRTITAILCYKIDRISRNMSDYSLLVEKMGLELISATEQLPSNATGRLMGDMQAAFSRYSSAQLSERVSDAMAEKAKQGIYPSYAPVGYVNDPVTKTIVPDPKRAQIIHELFETYADTDIPLSGLVKWAKKRGLTSRKGNPLRKSTIHKLLTNPIYCGMVRWSGVSSQGTHQPLISKLLFDRVQEKLTERGKPKTKHHFPFRGLLVCGECGCQITASLAKGKYVYYHCTNGRSKCQQPYIRQEALSERLQSVVDNVRIPEETVALLLQKVREGEEKRDQSIKAQLQQLENEANELDRRRKQAYLDKQDGVLSKERWQELEEGWVTRLEAITEQRQRLRDALRTTGTDSAKEAFELLERSSDLYAGQSYSEQARALKLLVSNCALKGENVDPNYRKPFDLVALGVKTGDWYT